MSQPVPTDVRAPTLPLAGEERDWGARIRAGDAAAFERAFRTYHPALCKFAFRYVHSRDVAQELVHDVFATLWEERGRLSVDRLKSYLYAAVRNLAISHLRHELVERRWRGRAPPGAAPPAPKEGGGGPATGPPGGAAERGVGPGAGGWRPGGPPRR